MWRIHLQPEEMQFHLQSKRGGTTYLHPHTRFLCLLSIPLHPITGADIFGYMSLQLNTLRPRQKCRHFADDIFKCILLNENVWISLKICLKFVLKVPINNIPVLVQIMAWRRSGDTQLSEPMMISLLTHVCVSLGLNELREAVPWHSWKQLKRYTAFHFNGPIFSAKKR